MHFLDEQESDDGLMMSESEACKLEKMFLEKLTERFRLTDRDLKKAFGQFDTNGSGILELSELNVALKSFLNGVDDMKIRELSRRFDPQGIGKVAYHEFVKYLMAIGEGKKHMPSVNAIPTKLVAPVKVGTSSGGVVKQQRRPLSSQGSVTSNIISPRAVAASKERKKPVFASSPAVSYGAASPADIASSPSLSPRTKKQIKDRPEISEEAYAADDTQSLFSGASDPQSDDLHETASATSRTISSTSALNPSSPDVKIRIFLKGLESYLISRAKQMKGGVKLADRLTMHSHDLEVLVAKEILTNDFQRYVNRHGFNSGPLTIDFRGFSSVLKSYSLPGVSPLRSDTAQLLFEAVSGSQTSLLIEDFIDVVFPPKQIKRVVINNKPSDQEVATKVDSKFMHGPIRVMKDVNIPKPSGRFNPDSDQLIQAHQQKFKYPKSRNSFVAPVDFDETWVSRSLQPPAYSLNRSHVFGLSSMQGGSSIMTITKSIPVGLRSSEFPTERVTESRALVYASAAVCVIHDLNKNRQAFFVKHTDNVSCLTVSTDGMLAASGQVGRKPCVHVWRTESNRDVFGDLREDSLVATIGQGFFERSVNCIAFSFDAKYLVAVSCDDKHRIGVFQVSTGLLVRDAQCQNGLPPQIRDICWAPAQQFAGYINKETSGMCDVFCTVGENHLKFWSFSRPITDSNIKSSFLSNKNSKIPSELKDVTASKIYNACCFVPSSTGATASGSFDVVTAGANGFLYLWRQGVCVAAVRVDKADFKICLAMCVGSPYIACGSISNGGSVKVYDARNLTPVIACNITPSFGMPSTVSSGDTCSVLSICSFSPSALTARSSGFTVAVALSNGKCGRVSINIPTRTQQAANARGSSASSDASQAYLFSYHLGTVWNVAWLRIAEKFKKEGSPFLGKQIAATIGEDRFLLFWDLVNRVSIGCALLEDSGTCCDFDRSGQFILVGLMNGSISLYSIDASAAGGASRRPTSRGGGVSSASDSSLITVDLTQEAFRKDRKVQISDVKFSPDNSHVAVGAHDDCIYIYGAMLRPGVQCKLSMIYRLAGHSSYITHVDWSSDGRLLRSTCGGYELLFWNAEEGKQFMERGVDYKWASNSVTLGFNLMGIWPPCSDGTDINQVDVSRDLSLVVTAGDHGKITLFNYPCIAKDAPGFDGCGHSSFVTGVKFISEGLTPSMVISSGGEDKAVMLWTLDGVKPAGKTSKQILRQYRNEL